MWSERLKGIEDTVAALRVPYRVVRPYTGEALEPGRYRGIVISGGAPNVSEIDQYPFLHGVIDFAKREVDDGVPLLGICLGHQVLAAAIGGKVVKAQQPEAGFNEIYHNSGWIFKGLPERMVVFQYHFDEVAALPAETEVLASSPRSSVQAFKVNDRPAFGVQFHPEISLKRGLSILSSREQILTQRGFDVKEAMNFGRANYDHELVRSVITRYIQSQCKQKVYER
jgi:GMP synthase (glutamine-hydrolysing)